MRAILVTCALGACAAPEPTLPPGVYRCDGAVTLPIGNYASDVVVADFNGDGVGDVATIGTWGMVNVLLGTGPRLVSASEIQLAGDGHSLAAGDFDGDGQVDLALVRGAWADPRLSVLGLLRGRGDGTFEPESSWTLDTSVAAFAISMRPGNPDRDGPLDIVLGLVDGAMVLRGRPGGEFETLQELVGSEFGSIDLGDLDRDGAPDLVAADIGYVCFFTCDHDWVDGKLVIRRGRGDGTFGDPVTVASDNFSSVRVADLDGDADLDLVALSLDRHVLLNDGLGNFDSSVTYHAGQIGGDALIADLDRDGMLDVVQTTRAGRDPTGVYVSYGRGDGTFSDVVTFELEQAGAIAAGDVDGNGAPELFVLGQETLQVLPTRCFVDGGG